MADWLEPKLVPASGSPVAPHGVLAEFYGAQTNRERYVRSLFDATASDYDRLSRILSMGTDRWYRRRVLNRAGFRAGQRLLDVATGTGLVVRAAMELGAVGDDIVGVDPSAGMLAAHTARGRVSLVQARGEQLPLAAASFDLVTMGYALRHVADLGSLFNEFRRVLRPGGRVLVLEITRPTSRWLRTVLGFYLGRVVPHLLGRRRRAESARLMQYYWRTIEECVPAATVMGALVAAGFAEVRCQHTGPMLTDYLALRGAH